MDNFFIAQFSLDVVSAAMLVTMSGLIGIMILVLVFWRLTNESRS